MIGTADKGKRNRPKAWIEHYDRCRRHPENRRMHAIGLPLVTVGLLMLIWPLEFLVGGGADRSIVPVALLAVMAMAAYGCLISFPLTITLMLLLLPLLLLLDALAGAGVLMVPSGTALLAAGWLLLYRGQRQEGTPPFLLGRLQYLPVGLLWLLSLVFRQLKLPW
ncbi:putative membrane protein YGL010W [Natronospira proteinivora]|uniref:Membrane protein YGL010W n=1 Tax=Natronospira proteinivora TaxID=1807133 RepID=A0ABT1G9P4_9GAMM|nr:Mpo1-like protein [Natronospira proteinivora]MCP1728044.1 putative membrane protein YGL010W [Natronospira proteinivora]